MIKYIVIILFLGVFGLFAQKTFAQNNTDLPIKQVLRITPIIIDTKLKQGHNLFEIRIDNLLDIPLGISALAENFNPLEEGDSLENLNQNNSLIGWTEIKDKNVLIDAKGSKVVNVDILVPSNIKQGGFSEVIFFTPIYVKDIDPSAPTVLSRVGVLILGNVGDINYKDLAKKVTLKSFNFNSVGCVA